MVGEDESLYPLKYIYSLIVNAEPKSFNTSEPISVFTKLDVELLHIPKSASDDFYKRVQESLKNKHARKARLKKANGTPAQKTSKIVIYDLTGKIIYDNGFLKALKAAETLKIALKEKFERYIMSVILMGSIAQGRATEESDVDIAVIETGLGGDCDRAHIGRFDIH